MKQLLFIFIILVFNTLNAQNTSKLSFKQTMVVAQKLMKYYNQYENGASESVKIAKFNEYINQVNPNLSQADRKKAFRIVNAYIESSKGKTIDMQLTQEQKQQVERMLQETAQKKQEGMHAMHEKMQDIKNMSYSEYKNFATQNGQIPLPEADIQKAYNQMHQNDGKKVKVTAKTTITKIDNPVVAIEIVRHPKKHTYQEFKIAMKYLKPDISEEEIQKIWNKNK